MGHHVLILKSYDEELIERLKGLIVSFCKVLTSKGINTDQLRKVFDEDEYDSIIFTSQRAVEEFCKVLKEVDENHWIHRCNAWCVGQKTGKALMDNVKEWSNLSKPKGMSSGNAEMLSKEVKGDRILFLSGEKRLDTIPEAFKDVDFKEIQIYRTWAIPIKDEWESLDCIVVYSPSGAQVAKEMFDKYKDAKIVAIGPTTASSLEKWKDRLYVANKPTSEEVAKIINELFQMK